MKKRMIKKRAKSYMDRFTCEKIPLAFNSERERKLYVTAWARAYVNQKHKFPKEGENAC